MLDKKYNHFQGGGVATAGLYHGQNLEQWWDKLGHRWAVSPRMGKDGIIAVATFRTEEEAKHYIDRTN